VRLLLTSDWQTDVSNLDLCETALSELIDANNSFMPDAIIHGGDLKEPYSPVHVAVVQFWVHAVKAIRAAEHQTELIILEGNHDRTSQSPESKSWLDIMRMAGAVVATKPKLYQIENAGWICLLPYIANKEKEKKAASRLWRVASKKQGPRVCIFHTEIAGAAMSPLIKAVGNTVEDLRLDRYDAAFGGHLHDYQRVTDTVYYIGSPFCHSWAEADSRKGFVYVEITE
jgi:DNA repair exonuclease SbcCD nuclease subunit